MTFRSLFEASSPENSSDAGSMGQEIKMPEETYLELLGVLQYCYPIKIEPSFNDWDIARMHRLYECAEKLEVWRAMEAIANGLCSL